MKNILLGLAACTVSLATLAQEPFSCSTDEMRRRMIEMDPSYLAREAAYAEEIRQLIANNTTMRDEHPVITIPIVFHILHLGGAENIPNEQIYEQMRILNEDFRKLNSDTSVLVPFYQDLATDARIEFRLPTLDPLGNCTNGINRIYSVETLRGRDESKISPWPRSKYLNVWVAQILESGAGGYAYLPGSAEGPMQWRDGIMIRRQQFGTSGGSDQRSLTHEIGHYFNLIHVWGQTNEPEVECGDDGVEDTPITAGHDNCTQPGILYDYECSSSPITTEFDFFWVPTGGGNPDPTPIEETYVINVTDTIGVGFDVTPFSAEGVGSGSEIEGEYAFAGWDPEAADGATVADLSSGSIDLGRYYEVTFTPRPGMAMDATQLTFEVRRSNDGPRSFAVRMGPGFGTNLSVSGGAAIQVNSSGAHFVADDDSEWITINVNLGSGPAMPYDPVTIRFYAWNAETAEGHFSIDNVDINGTVGKMENVQNFMEYSFCIHMFTADQVERMRAALLSPVGQRNTLYSEETLQAVGIADGFQAACPPKADFYAIPGAPSFTNPTIPYPKITCVGENVQFRDNSGGEEATSWEWTFQDGDPATSNEQNPIVSFTSTGWKSVTLTVSNANGSDTKTSPFELLISGPEDALQGLASYSFEEPVGMWPFVHANYENNITYWDRYVGAGHSGNASMRLNAGDRNFLDLDPMNDQDYDDLISPNLDLTGVQDATLSFWYSYSTMTTDLEEATERLEIHRSTDCGKTWNYISSIGQSTIEDEDLITNGNSTLPGGWRFRSYNIPSNMLTENVRFRWRFISSAFSNHLYLDDINIGGPVGINEAIGNTTMSVYPNPTNDHFFVEMAGMDVLSTEVTLMDGRGAIVFQKNFAPQGGKGIMISSRELGIANGLYVLRVSNDEGTSVQKLTVGR